MLIYLGVLEDEKTAVFMVDSGVVAQGDGTCKPSRTTCETIHIKEGETEFFDVAPEDSGDGHATAGTGAQYQLDVIKIRKKSTTHAKQAKKSRGARLEDRAARSCAPGSPATGRSATATTPKPGRLEKLSPQGLQGRRRQGGRAPPAPTSKSQATSGAGLEPGAA